MNIMHLMPRYGQETTTSPSQTSRVGYTNPPHCLCGSILESTRNSVNSSQILKKILRKGVIR